MVDNLLNKCEKLDLSEGALIKRMEKVKKKLETGAPANENQTVSLDISEQIKNINEEVTKKIDEVIRSKSEQINANDETIKEFDTKLNKMENAVSATKQRTEEIKERVDKIDETLLELMSLYEVVSSTINPFVEGNNPVAHEKIEELDKKIETLSQKMPSGSSFKEEFEARFKAIEGNLEAFAQTRGTNTFDEETLIGKVSEQVLERIKPYLEKQSHADKLQDAGTKQSVTLSDIKSAQNIKERADENEIKLTHLDNSPETSVIIFNWIDFIMEKVGRNNLFEVLEYYVEMGWITEEVGSKIMVYANGLDYYAEKPTWKLLPEDHLKSLMFIEKLTGRKTDKVAFFKLGLEKSIGSNRIHTVPNY